MVAKPKAHTNPHRLWRQVQETPTIPPNTSAESHLAMQRPLWARLGFVVLGIHTDVQQRVLRRHHRTGSRQHEQCLPQSHPHSQPSQVGELGGDRAAEKGDSTGGVWL